MGWEGTTELVDREAFDRFRKVVEEQYAGMRKDIAELRGKPVSETPAKTRGQEIAELMVERHERSGMWHLFDHTGTSPDDAYSFLLFEDKAEALRARFCIASAIDSALAEQSSKEA